jgi:chemotaxis regulatin CheY-phosphate phosphatase CheZ
MTAFMSQRESEEESRNLARNYRDFLVSFGAQKVDLNIELPEVYVLKIFDSLEAVFTRGPYLAGVHEASDEKRLKILVQTLYDGLSETGDGT